MNLDGTPHQHEKKGQPFRKGRRAVALELAGQGAFTISDLFAATPEKSGSELEHY